MGGLQKKKKKVPGRPTRTVDSVEDERFKTVLKNPVYRPVPKKEKKVEIDKRFKAMFDDERFKLKYKVDKRGRPVETTTDENLKRYYNLEGDGEEEDKEDDSSSEEDESGEDDQEIEGNVKEEEIGKKSKLKLDEITRKKLHSSEVDYARGEGDLKSEESSSDDDDDSSDTEEESFLEHEWGELDKDAARTEDSTRRLALCNMDWDRVRAVDLMVLLSSFLPAGGVLKSVTIYPSQFGKEQMAEEEVKGPKELLANGGIKLEKEDDSDFDDEEGGSGEEDEEGEGSQYHREKLRQYQLNRLKYFYAVAEFDSVQTAEKVYAECDGMEYESSAAKVDLRFIPDDMSFEDDEPRDQCTQLPDAAKYRPRFFTTTALQQVKVDLTWDETDPMRKELMEKIFDPKGDVNDDDIKAYLATSSESEAEEEVEEKEEVEEEPEEKNPKKSKDAISKYKDLLNSIESTEKKKKEKDVQMEITWGVGLKQNTEKLVKKKLEEEEKAKRTPWQEMLDKRREKKKQRKQERKRKGSGSEDSSNSDTEERDKDDDEGDDQPFSDDDVDIDMNDEFFRSEMRENDIFKEQKKKKKSKEIVEKDKLKTEKKKKEDNAALELLLMDDDDNKKHFSLKKILDGENDTKSKKKRMNKKKRMKMEEEAKNPKPVDDFEINVDDNRFSALFSSHHFNVDPSDPNFKKTKAMEKIIAEKQKRRGYTPAEEKEVKERVAEPKIRPEVKKSAELSFLVKSIKRNTENLKSKKSNFKTKSKF